MPDCVFCKIIDGTYTSSKIYEDDDLLAFVDIQPVNPGHVLIITKKHVENISDLDDALTNKIFILAKKISKAIKKSDIKAEGVNYFLAEGEAAGQEVFHVHLHVFPRFENDGFGLVFPDGYKNKKERQELDKAADKIKAVLEIQ
jgi:histidine triad (HIT) family protein